MRAGISTAMCVAGITLSAALQAAAGEVVWASAASGVFTEGASWAGGIAPGAGDGAVFSANGGYIVSLAEDAIAGYIAIDGSDPVFQFPDSRLDLGFVGVSPVSLSLGRTMGSISTLLFVDGTTAGDTMYVAEATGSTATLTLGGGTTQLLTTNRLDIGRAGQGTLNVFSGALADCGLSFIGALPGSQGEVHVNGAGSLLDTGLVVVGAEGDGLLSIENGGLVKSTGVRVGDADGAGTLSLSGAGSHLDAAGAVVVIGSGGDGSLSMSNGQISAQDLVFGTGASVADVDVTNSLFFLTGDLVVGSDGDAVAVMHDSMSALCDRLVIAEASAAGGMLMLDGTLSALGGIDVAPGSFSFGTLDIGLTGAASSPLVRVFVGGLLTGGGLINGNIDSSGVVSPSGTLTVTGNYTQSGSVGPGAFFVDAASSPRTLDISGSATLTGLFRLTVANGYSPMPGENFVTLRAGSIIGDFTSFDLPSVDWSVAIVGNEVIATFNGSGEPADLDSDGSVGAGDLAILLAAWGPCPGCAADLDGDNTVGAGDLAILLAAWG